MGKFHPEYRQLANPKHFNRFLDGGGVLSKRDEMADRFDYNWHARKLAFEPHFRSYVLLHITKYTSARDLQWAMREDPLFQATGVRVEISVSGFTQANAQRPLEPYLVMLTSHGRCSSVATPTVAAVGQEDLAQHCRLAGSSRPV